MGEIVEYYSSEERYTDNAIAFTAMAYDYPEVVGLHGLWFTGGAEIYHYGRDWHISIWDRETGDWAVGINFYGATAISGAHAKYDIYGATTRVAQQAAFIKTLQNLTSQYIVVIAANHAPEYHIVAMHDEIVRCGGTYENLDWIGIRKSYICVGIVGSGEGAAITEVLDNAIDTANGDKLYAYTEFTLEVEKPKISNNGIKAGVFSEMGVTDGIVGYWPLDNDTNDLSGNNVIETSTNITYTTGIKSSAGNFNGTTSQITFDSEIFRNDSFTMSIWINAINVGSGQNFSGILSITSGVRLLIDSNGDLVFKTYNGSTDDLMEYNTNLYDSNWHQVVATYSYNDKKLYLNSNLVDSGSYINNWNYSDNATIGYNIDSIISHFYGYLDEVKIYKRALSIEEINIEYEMIKEKKLKMTNSTIFTNGIIEG